MSTTLVGQKLGRYEVGAVLGAGNMGMVYRGRDTLLGREVAIKVMGANLARQAAFRERFLPEAQLAMKLTHPGVVSVYDVGEQNGELYLVMTYIVGSTLSAFLDKLQTSGELLQVGDAVRLVEAIATALAYAHTQGVHHQDIRPGNILLQPTPTNQLPVQPVLTDLWLSNLVDNDATNQGINTEVLAYLPPEELLSQAPAGASGEVYSLGVLLYRLCTGQLPCSAKKVMDVIRYHMSSAPMPPTTHRPDLPDSVATVIMTALAKDPAGRYPSPRALARTLNNTAKTLRPTSGNSLATYFTQPVTAAPSRATNHQPPATNHQPPATSDRLIAHMPNGTVLSYPLTQSTITIGQTSVNNFVLNHPSVAEQHVSLRFDGDSCSVTDLNTLAGTFLDSAQLLGGMPEPWPAGATLYIGECRVELQRKPKQNTQSATLFMQSLDLETAEAEADQVAIQLQPANLTVHPGREIHLPLTVLNQGRLVDHFSLKVVGLPTEWVTAPDLAQLFPGEQSNFSLALHPPLAHQSKAGDYPFTIEIHSQALERAVGRADSILKVEAYHDLQLYLEPERQRNQTLSTYALNIYNNGNSDLTLNLTANDREGACEFTFAETKLFVSAGAQRTVDLTVNRYNHSAAIAERAYNFVITARPENAPGVIAEARGEWVHLPPNFAVDISPRQQRTLGTGRFKVTVTNPDDDDFIAILQGSDGSAACEYRFDPPELLVPAGQTATTNLIITPHHAQPDQGEKVHNFTIRASIATTSSVAHEVQGTWVQLSPHFEVGLVAERAEDAVSGLYHVNMRNDSQVDLTLRPSGVDRNGVCEFSFKPAIVRVPAGQSRQILATVQQRKQALVASPQTHVFTISARPEEAPRVSEKTEGQWTQPAPTFTFNVKSKEGEGITEGIFLAELHNHEQVDISFDFSASDVDNQCEFALSPQRGKIKAGTTGQIAVRVRRRNRQLVEKPTVFPFTLSAQPTSLPRFSQTGKGKWRQTPPTFTYSLSALEGEGVTDGLFVAEVHNTSPIDLGFDLSAQDPQGALEYALATNQGKVKAGQTAKIQCRVKRRGNQLAITPTTYPFSLSVSPMKVPELAQTEQAHWLQNPATFTLELIPQTKSDTRESVFQVKLKNPSPVLLQVKLDAGDPAGNCKYSLVDNELTIPSGKTVTTQLTVQRQAPLLGTESKAHAFSVNAALSNAPSIQQTIKGEWVQIPTALKLELLPTTQKSRKKSKFTVQVLNETDVKLMAVLSARDEANGLNYQWGVNEIVVPAGGKRNVNLTITATSPFPKKTKSRTHPFVVQSTANEIPGFTTETTGEWEERPTRRWGCGCLILLAIIIFIAAVLAFLWFDPLLLGF